MERFETLRGGTRIYISDTDPVAVDSLLLAAFVGRRAKKTALELGSGNAAALLWLFDRGLLGRGVALELRRGASELARRSAAECGAPIEFVEADARDYRSARKFDLVISNPPYFRENSGRRPKDAARFDMKFENSGGLADFCAAAARNLKQGGSFSFCFPCARLAAAFCALRDNGLEPKRLRLVAHEAGGEPYLALCDARYRAGEGLKVEPTLATRSGGAETAEYSDITATRKGETT